MTVSVLRIEKEREGGEWDSEEEDKTEGQL